ncbi:O-linked N-acetylglucosamine transferase family protein, partial [Magnetococcales bacterium HHB-1]
FSRLAPVQCMTFGHPDTSGIPNMDYFISSDLQEIPSAQNHYSERLVLLSSELPCYYFPPGPGEDIGRTDLNLPEQGNLYLCPQSLFKVHPEFDLIIEGILNRDPDGFLVLISERGKPRSEEMLLARFKRSFSDSSCLGRIHFVPTMSNMRFVGLLKLADVILDTPYFSGGISSSEIFGLGLVTVTWPKDYMCGRVTLAQYKQMEIDACVVSSAEGYIQKAVQIATDPDYQQQLRALVHKRAPRLFERQEAVSALEHFFIKATEAACAGKWLPMKGWESLSFNAEKKVE